MLCKDGVRVLDTIGGGSIEFQSVKSSLEAQNTHTSFERLFTLRQGGDGDIGMVCGGDAHVWFWYITASDENRAAFCNALSSLENGTDLYLAADTNTWRGVFYTGDVLPSAITENPPKADAPVFADIDGVKNYVEKLYTNERVFIFGGGHISRELQPLLSHIGFDVTVIDDRQEFADKADFPTARKVICADYADENVYADIRPDDYAVVMTRGHIGDYDSLLNTLRRPTKYVGSIGSKKKTAFVKDKLSAAGISQEKIDCIYTPIGLAIGAETPAEIAVSIAAEIIKVRRT
jgi:xanthine dehydrogenase accessory factor